MHARVTRQQSGSSRYCAQFSVCGRLALPRMGSAGASRLAFEGSTEERLLKHLALATANPVLHFQISPARKKDLHSSPGPEHLPRRISAQHPRLPSSHTANGLRDWTTQRELPGVCSRLSSPTPLPLKDRERNPASLSHLLSFFSPLQSGATSEK